MLIRCIDTETTGLDPKKDQLCEVGWVDLDLDEDAGTLKRKGLASMLVNPGIPIPPEISAVHHIVDEDVRDVNLTPAGAIEIVSGADAYVAHNAAFEKQFLPFKTWICTYKVGVTLWPDAPGHSLQTLRYWLGLIDIPHLDRATAPMHRALPDSQVCEAVFLQMLKHGLSVSEMVGISENPVKLPRFRFGKHGGEPIKDIPTSYLTWMLENGNFDDENVVYTAQQELERRRNAR